MSPAWRELGKLRSRAADRWFMTCDHSDWYSGAARYLREGAQLRLVLVCDHCGAERAQLGRIDYRVQPRCLVMQTAELIARELGLSEELTIRVRLGAMVCRAGRDQLSRGILNKKGSLTREEWTEVRRQPELAAALLSDVSLDDIREWILCHRERPDGSGYPRGLVGEQIPLEARILAVAEAYAAMVSDRPHRARRDHEDACMELVRCAGTQFDAAVVKAFVTASLPRNPLLLSAAA
jgi:HD-GYP domain-containing protein (c-di-GMP phosphodiesterase class II)